MLKIGIAGCIIVSLWGLTNCIGFITQGGAGPFDSWLYGMGPFLGGGIGLIIIINQYQKNNYK